MAKRRFRPEDAYRLVNVADPDLSPDGRRVAFVVMEVDEAADRQSSSIWLVPLDGSAPARRFTDGPADKTPRWSPDGRFLAYLSITDDQPRHAHVRLAPLEGGVPWRLGDLTGPVSQLAWSPDSRRIVVVCRIGVPDPDQLSAAEKNAARVTRGLAARFDGVGWQEGRRHLFTLEVSDGSATQVTRGEFDHADPAFSPDGQTIVFASDRHARRDDRQFQSDAWVVPLSGGRPRRLTDGDGRVAFPLFSPDGSMVAFAGQEAFSYDEDNRVFVVPTDGGPSEVIAPETDRGVPISPGMPSPFCWTGEQEIAMIVADRGGLCLHRTRLGDRLSDQLIGGDTQIDGLSARAGQRAAVFSVSWPDRPSELHTCTLDGKERDQLTHLNDALLDEVELTPVTRATVTRPDGTDVEYFAMVPVRRGRRRLPLHLDIHGGPHGAWPSGRSIAFHQSIAAGGYALVLPNPRGSTGYGAEFTAACTGDWGGADCEDILACCDDLIARGVADGGRMFVSGGSYGGFMTSWIVGHTRRFRAATAVAALIDQTSQALTCDIPHFCLFNMGGTPWERSDEYQKRSPLSYLPGVTTPVLVIHWEGDLRVPVSQGEELYSGLRLLGKEAELVRYPGGFHITRTPSQAVDWVRRMLAWNQRHDIHQGDKASGQLASR